MTVDQLVRTAYDNAIEGGYGDDLNRMTPEQVAVDMTSFDSDLEDKDLDEVILAVKKYRESM